MRALRIAVAIAGGYMLCGVSAYAAQLVPIDSCYQQIHQHEIGVLTQDLDCTNAGGSGPDISLEAGAKLQLGGYTITGGTIGIGVDAGKHKTVITGPGAITGQVGSGPVEGCGLATGTSTIVENVEIYGSWCGIVASYTPPLKLKSVNVHDCDADGITYAIPVDKGKIKMTESVIENNGGYGVDAYTRLTMKAVQVLDNTTGGAQAGTILTARSSTLTGNGPGGDVAAALRVKVTNTTCDHSLVTAPGKNDSFHVCALDTP